MLRSVKTRVFGQHRRYLDPRDPARTDVKYGSPELRPPPPPREHAHMQQWGARAALLRHHKPAARYKEHVSATGLTDLSPLVEASPFLTSTGFNPQDQCWLDLMHLIQNIVNLHMMSRIGGRSSLPTVPTNNMKQKTAAELQQLSQSARIKWQKEWSERNQEVAQLKIVREEIIEQDSKWELSTQAKMESEQRFRDLVCPTAFFNKNKPIWEFTGSWKTSDWQHFMERHAALALYGFLDDDRLALTIELFEILSVLAKYSHTRNELTVLRVRAVRTLVEFQAIGPLQEHTVVFHLIIHLIDQAIRWGPPSSVWMYPYERYLGFLCRQLKSKKNPEANILSRYCKSRSSSANFDSLALDVLSRDLSVTSPTVREDCFPKTRRGKKYTFVSSDVEQLHDLFESKCPLYLKVSTEWRRAHKAQNDPAIGMAIQRWDLHGHQEGKVYKRNNPIDLQTALETFRLHPCRIITSGVWHLGERRTGSVDAAAPHRQAHSLFQFTSGDPFSFGRILFFFELAVPMHASAPSPLRLAKVQILKYLGPDQKTKLPVLIMNSRNKEAIVSVERIGRVVVCAQHPDVTLSTGRFLLLPWPRQNSTTKDGDD
jgi:hypothetical protein